MGIEGGGDKREGIRIHLEEMFADGKSIEQDTYNAWSNAIFVSETDDFDRLRPVLHYSEYLLRPQVPSENQWISEFIIQKSSPSRVAAFNQLVDEFNADLERIKREKDVQTIKNFIARVQALLYPKK